MVTCLVLVELLIITAETMSQLGRTQVFVDIGENVDHHCLKLSFDN